LPISKNDSPSSSLPIRRSSNNSLFVSERSNMDYVTIAGVCKRTGAKEDQLAVFLLKELVDNAIDYIELYAPPVTARTTTTNDSISSIENEEPQIHIDITYNHNDQYVVIRVKNSNFGIEDAGFTEQRLHSIFANLDVFH
jgi:hypothetical protein